MSAACRWACCSAGCCCSLPASGHLAAALILPLYYLADATITLVRRAAGHQPIWQAHRSHFYQRAIDQGLTVPEIVRRVFLVNLALAALALSTLVAPILPHPILLAGADRSISARRLAARDVCARQA